MKNPENMEWLWNSKKRKLQNKYLTVPDTVYLTLLAISLLIALLLFLINQTFFHFQTTTLYDSNLLLTESFKDFFSVAAAFGFFLYGLTIKLTYPRTSTFFWGYTAFFLSLFANLVLAQTIQATPFSPIDHRLAKIDTGMGIHALALMAWVYHHPLIHRSLNIFYDLLVLELFLIPILLICINARHALMVFFITQLSTLIIGAMIYYFFPTEAPSGIFYSPLFSEMQRHTSLRFYEIHHYIHAQLPSDGGLVAFPSFHVIWVILLSYALKDIRYLFYPIAVINLIIIASTVLLGWHYFCDVMSGMIIAVTGIYMTEKWIKCNV